MKHHLFALAGAVATVALANDPTPRTGVDLAIDGFENYTAGNAVTAESAAWTGSLDATVTAYESGEAPTGITFPQPFSDAGANYLAIDSGSEEVTRSVSGASQGTVYIDTLAQFSVLKAGEPAPDAADAKILLWLQEDTNVVNDVTYYSTNLHVKGGFLNDMEPTPGPNEGYKLDKSCEPGSWCRVTITAYKTIVNDVYRAYYANNTGPNVPDIPAFLIQINGEDAKTTEITYDVDFLDTFCPDQTGASPGNDDFLPQFFYERLTNKKLILAMNTAETSDPTVSQVAFKGTGAIDDLVLTTYDPSKPPLFTTTLSWPDTLSTVSYTLDGVAGEVLTASAGTATISGTNGAPVVLTGSIGYTTKTVTGSITDGGVIALPAIDISYYFPLTATAGQDGTAAHPFEVADVTGLKALQAAVAASKAGNLVYAQTADIDMASAGAWAGIGVYADAALTHADARPFTGTYDGQGHKISNITFTDRDYAGVFNRVDGGTVKNLTVENISYIGTGNKYCASIVGYALNGATLENLTSAGIFGLESNPGKHNMAGIVIRVSGGTSGDGTQVLNCTNNATIYGQYTKLAGICAISQEKIASGNPKMVFTGCANNGTLVLTRNAADLTGFAGIVGYSDVNTTMTDCSNTGTLTQLGSGYNTDHTGALIGHVQGHSIADGGNNSAPADKKMIGNWGGTVTGFQYATVNSGIATTVLPPLVSRTTYLLEGNVAASETPVCTLAAAGDTIAFDTALGYTFAGTVAAAEGLTVTDETVGTVKTYTAVAPVSFTLNWPTTLTEVSYTVNDGASVALTPISGTATITDEPGATVALTGSIGYADKTVEGTLVADGSLTLPAVDFSYYFPMTATAGQDGTSDHPYEIDSEKALKSLQAAVAAGFGRDKCYVQTADITLTAAWEGIGFKGGKDHVSEAAYDNGAFTGVYDGGNYTISNFQMESGTDYGALFNSVYDATIKNLKISYKESKLTPSADTKDDSTGATFVGVAKSSTLQNLTALAGTVTTVSAYKDMGGIVGYLMAGSTVDSCTNELNVASTKGGRKCGGIAIITQGGSGTAVVRNCKNSGTIAGGNQDGAIVGYIGTTTAIIGCENTANAPLLTCESSGAVTVSGGTKSVANRAAFVKHAGTVNGLNFATVDGNVATFVADNALALNGEYKVMASGATATYAFAEAGTIAFDTALYTPTYAITAAEGLTLSDEKANGVVTYTAASSAPAPQYKVVIDGTDVPITQADDILAALAEANYDTSSASAVNAALAGNIPGTTTPVWQALFLGLPPTEAGLESFKIASISFNGDGNVVLTLPASVELKTGRGVNIALNLMGSDDLSSWTFIEAATGTTFAPVTPAANETAKFYKVVAVFTATTPSAD